MGCKILHFRSPSGLYGAERVILSLSKYIPNSMIAVLIDKREPHPELYEEAVKLGIRAYKIPSRGRFDPTIWIRLFDIIRKEKVNIIHCHDYKTIFYGSLLLYPGLKKVVTLHGDTGKTGIVKFYEALSYSFLKFYSKISVVSNQLYNKALRFVPESKVFLIKNGIELKELSSADTKIKMEHIIDQYNLKQCTIISVIGRLSYEKGQDILLDGIIQHKEEIRIRNIKFLFIGSGDKEKELRELVSKNQLQDIVIFIPQTPEIELYYGITDIVVMPSREEGMPLVALESLGYGKLLIATEVGELPKLKEEGAPIFLTPKGESESLIKTVLKVLELDELEKTNLREKAKEFIVKNYHVESMSDKYRKYIYEGV